MTKRCCADVVEAGQSATEYREAAIRCQTSTRPAAPPHTKCDLLASEGAVHTDKAHTWHMELMAKLCAADSSLLLATPFPPVHLNDLASYEAAT